MPSIGPNTQPRGLSGVHHTHSAIATPPLKWKQNKFVLQPKLNPTQLQTCTANVSATVTPKTPNIVTCNPQIRVQVPLLFIGCVSAHNHFTAVGLVGWVRSTAHNSARCCGALAGRRNRSRKNWRFARGQPSTLQHRHRTTMYEVCLLVS